MSKFRGFIAIDIDASTKILDFKKEIDNTGANIKLVKPENIHLTLKFLGDTDETLIDQIENIIKESVKDIEPFTLKLIGTGVFPNPNYIKVIWIGIQNGQTLETIAQQIDNQLSNLGFKKEKRGFKSHLTMGRVKTSKNKEKLVKTIEKYADTDFGDYKIESIKLKKSDLTPKGPIYSTLKEIKI